MKPTIYDIAKLAGVSTATVSKVFNRTGNISEATRSKVLRISRELKYQPSMVASALAGKNTYSLGLLIPDLVNPFFAELARHVEDRAHALGYNLIICNTDNDINKEIQYIQLLRQKSVDGIIVATGVRDDDALKELIHQQVPVVLVAREMSMLAVSTVLTDDFVGGYNAASHLLELGHRRIGLVAESMTVSSSKERVRGCRYALEEAGVPYDDKLLAVSDFSVAGGKEAAAGLLREEPTAIFACNDLLAIGVMQAAKEAGLAIPSELSVIGFDNTILATITDPPMTTIAQPIRAIGHQVVDLITREINGEQVVKQRVVLLPELIRRGSTAARSE
ncbi:LacI family transcriptional regulator [Paenibacillus sp. 598K]|uniref:LacI family DNA-binding transcriptional regulator n=1 Tax=Paenibacillus sp. 598K TaxID=1117987 RepID=UPI000FFAE9BB|nr:LacI family DNA-binding transcriptional regulator [Paenibacillus sp. 598K]GBF76751.1 LacI family transcriptional regulator [Paenibacillus sp. 598K]